MDVIRVKSAGFCMGVSLALTRLDAAIARPQGKGRLLMFGPIIHNPAVLREYEAKGVIYAGGLEEVSGNDTLIIRAHGIPRELEQTLKATGVHLVDATCPRVKAAQLAIEQATAQGEPLWLFGEAEHPEVRGLVSYARGECHVFSDPAVLDSIQCRDDAPFVLAAQTTQENAVFQDMSARLKKRCPSLRALSTICDATSKRQHETAEVSREVELMIVLGGLTSGNTRRLADVARNEGIPAIHVELPEDIPVAMLAKYARVGLTAGASTPRTMVDRAQTLLKNLQF